MQAFEYYFCWDLGFKWVKKQEKVILFTLLAEFPEPADLWKSYLRCVALNVGFERK